MARSVSFRVPCSRRSSTWNKNLSRETALCVGGPDALALPQKWSLSNIESALAERPGNREGDQRRDYLHRGSRRPRQSVASPEFLLSGEMRKRSANHAAILAPAAHRRGSAREGFVYFLGRLGVGLGTNR
jgi:hypothetical protein